MGHYGGDDFLGGIIIRKEMTKQKKKAAKQAPSRTGSQKCGNGNHEQRIVQYVPMFDTNWSIIRDANGIVVQKVEELYIWNQEHRTQAKPNKGVWSIQEKEELKLFLLCRTTGCFVPWKKDKKIHKGWGVLHLDGLNHVIGRDYLGNDVKVCRFVESNPKEWHGFPVNYMRSKEVISDHVLRLWAYDLGYVDKSEIIDIKRHQKSSLA